MFSLESSLAEANRGELERFTYANQFHLALKEIWSVRAKEDLPIGAEHRAVEVVSESRAVPFEKIRFSRRPSPMPVLGLPEPLTWAIAFTPSFRRSVASVDKKLQGRVLTALSELSESPVKSHGDTIKPLTNELKGLWRYRVGDYRLLYEPKADSRTVVLIEFAARGGAYD
jgi:mRNA-degrading endonuclease RelE of RelBE toxin-antitoxin system